MVRKSPDREGDVDLWRHLDKAVPVIGKCRFNCPVYFTQIKRLLQYRRYTA